MAQLSTNEVIHRVIRGETEVQTCLTELVDREAGRAKVTEGRLIDFKQEILIESEQSVAEIARDILGFSNTDGAMVVVGITDDGHVIGHNAIDSRRLRERLGSYIGTRIDYDLVNSTVRIGGAEKTCPTIIVRRWAKDFPTLLRKHIELPGRFGHKVKYLAGSLFYREGAQTLVEPVGADIDEKAVELGFTGASPRARSSFWLEVDRPRLRLYAHINDRFFGRVNEISDLLTKFEDSRGRGISIAGQGGIGKTELAIEIVSRIHKAGKAKAIYSGSAKEIVLGPGGIQRTEPFFHDFPTFLTDLGTWLGIDTSSSPSVEELEQVCLLELKKISSVLLLVDNLEIVKDGRLFEFLDKRLPSNTRLITTSRTHKIKNWIYSCVLGELELRDAARLLRHELKRQGLEEEASSLIGHLEERVKKLHLHPLTIRWYAWTCKRDRANWDKGPEGIPTDELESFCVGHTLNNLSRTTLKVLGAIATTQGQTDLTVPCVSAVSGVTGFHLDASLYELESAGLITPAVDDCDGQVTYAAVPVGLEPVKDFVRKHGWESDFTRNLNSFLDRPDESVPKNPLLRELLAFEPRELRTMPPDEILEMRTRSRKVKDAPQKFQPDLLYLQAECERHLNNPITADDLYRAAAELILILPRPIQSEKYQRILIEAATVAKNRSHSEAQIKRAIGYLEAIQHATSYALRVLGTLAELHALLGDSNKYAEYRKRVTNLKDKEPGRYSDGQLAGLQEALERAEAYQREKTKKATR